MTPDQVRQLALALPEATEQPHFESASFRIRGRIFATLPAEGDRAHIFVGADDVHAAVAENPAWCAELWWGKKLSGLRIRLDDAEPGLVGELIAEAWRARAPKKLVAAFDQDQLGP